MKPTPPDPVIDEIREVRHRISQRCGHDAHKLVAYYIALQERCRDRLIHRQNHESSRIPRRREIGSRRPSS
jgi:hypothetical protein